MEGGVLPALFGTALMVMIMTIACVPLGVVAVGALELAFLALALAGLALAGTGSLDRVAVASRLALWSLLLEAPLAGLSLLAVALSARKPAVNCVKSSGLLRPRLDTWRLRS